MNKDINYYNKEVGAYSSKRYPKVSTDYVHFFFKKRKDILLKFVQIIVSGRTSTLSLLEIGCADGIIIGELEKQYKIFGRLVGLDVSSKMIEEAKNKNSDSIEFYVRDENINLGLFDVVIEVGVINLTDLETEFSFAKKHMNDRAYFICSLASRTSLRSRFKIKSSDFKNHLSFEEYEEKLANHFIIIKSERYGIFIPHIWKIPVLARIIQPIIEVIAGLFVPQWFHEKIYLLSKKP